MKTILDEQCYDRECAARYFGFWMMEPVWAFHALEAIKAGTFTAAERGEPRGKVSYTRTAEGIAIIPIAGPMQKFDSKYGGTNTLRTRNAVRTATRDPDVRGIMLHIDESPGGTVSGTAELAADIRKAGELKPLVAHIDDMGASAAYWAASQASRITANSQAEVGSIGGLAVIDDVSKRAEMLGIKVHAITAPKDSAYKGMGAEGTEITEKHLAQIQSRIDDLTGPFFQAVADGRGMPLDRVMELADGRVWIASKAQGMGLIDGVATLEGAMDAFRADLGPRQSGRMVARNRLRVSGCKL